MESQYLQISSSKPIIEFATLVYGVRPMGMGYSIACKMRRMFWAGHWKYLNNISGGKRRK